MGTSSGESGVRNLEAESIRSGVESMGGCVKLKTVAEIRRSSAHDTYGNTEMTAVVIKLS